MRNRVRRDSLDKGTLPLHLALSNPLAITRSCEMRVWLAAPICSHSCRHDGTIGVSDGDRRPGEAMAGRGVPNEIR